MSSLRSGFFGGNSSTPANKAVVFVWNKTLAKEGSENDYYPGALELLQKLIKKGIEIFVITEPLSSLHSSDLTGHIFNQLAKDLSQKQDLLGDALKRENFIWANDKTYAQYATLKDKKVQIVKDVNSQFTPQNVLFVDSDVHCTAAVLEQVECPAKLSFDFNKLDPKWENFYANV